MRWLFVDESQKSCESPCGMPRTGRKVLPPSVLFWNDTLFTYTMFVSFVSAWIFV